MWQDIQVWFNALNGTEQTFWVILIIAAAFFIIQAALAFIGMDADVDMDVDFTDGDTMSAGGAMSLFSLRSLVNFFLGFGLAGVTFIGIISQVWLVYVVATAVGLCFAFLYIFLSKKLLKLERNGAMKINECVGHEGNVYLRIPAEHSGKGKVQLSINGSIHELDAITEGPELKSGTHVEVVSVNGNELIVVAK